jgi:uncharacterized membrane protein YgdD (TMEM256/DUF423 family)
VKPQESQFEKVSTPLDMLMMVAIVVMFITIFFQPTIESRVLKIYGWVMFSLIILNSGKTLGFCALMTIIEIV